ncbi:DUF4492 domain-containing protein [Prevotella sp. oral taxon 299]|jgi:membrane protein|uniref:DUF4492 domain-containing protein n=1 Tax=Prevotella sp. oral taxon 299 TaxID=652716 RepID=UPI0001C40327|nr:DUF4492 domain-containing protein [Prevotella sp. oral taxon 299]EFC71808.1 hypothetical protein HMPREF0669_00480 [Prevotella sp. oral taxon 299 str. F0039]
MSNNNLFEKIFYLYYDGFKNMKLGKTLWLIIAIKLFIMFAILKVFFFPNHIKQQAPKGSESEYVSKELIQRSK